MTELLKDITNADGKIQKRDGTIQELDETGWGPVKPASTVDKNKPSTTTQQTDP